MALVKICGNTNVDDVKCAIDSGADFIGLIFAAGSKRQISLDAAQLIVSRFPKFTQFVGVFVNDSAERIQSIAQPLNLKWLQLHGNETPQFCDTLMNVGYQIIKAFQIQNQTSVTKIHDYPVPFYLFDTYKKDTEGGTGTTFDWKLLTNIPHFSENSFLAGGLTPSNVRNAIALLHPYAVDVASGVENQPGVKNHRLLKEFIQQAKQGIAV